MSSSRDPYRYFRIEARELLEGLQRGIADLPGGPDPARYALLLRLAHTLKGAARVVRLPVVSDAAHRLEDILARCRDAAAAPPSDGQQAELRRLVESVAAALSGIDHPAAPVAERAASEETASTAAAPPAMAAPTLIDTVRLQVAEIDSVLAGQADTSAELEALRVAFRAFERTCQQARFVAALAGRARAADGEREVSVRLHTEAGNLAAGLEGMRQRVAGRVERLERELQRLHEDTSQLRLLPTEALWTFLDHTVRDAAQTLDRHVRLETSSRMPRLDTAAFAGLQVALLHLVRNAVAHGIEPEAERRATGKPAEGVLRLRIEHGRGCLHVVCEDDGRGLDPEAVRRAAVAKGLLAADAAAPLEMAEAIRLVLHGGISTTHAATEMSGRGVGLDAVRAAMAKLRGDLAMTSTPGQGTAITLTVPVALASVEVLVVEAGGIDGLIPLGAVRRVARMDSAVVRSSERGEELHLEGQAYPYAALHRLLPSPAPSASTHPPARRRQLTVVLVRGDSGGAAVGVERVRGTIEAVVRPLPALADAAPLVSGASFNTSGAPRLVLDPRVLVEAILATGPETGVATTASQPILVVDDSLTTRMLEQSILESAGYIVHLAVSGEDALQRLRERRYGLLLVDVEMPGMDGFMLIEHLRREPACRDTPAILVTSRDSHDDRRRGLAAGAQDYVVKGEFDQRRLLQRIGELLA